jgi:hypothetical protein
VLRQLASMGHSSSLLDSLVEAAAGARTGAARLLGLLAPADVRKLVQVVEAAMEEAPDGSLLS